MRAIAFLRDVPTCQWLKTRGPVLLPYGTDPQPDRNEVQCGSVQWDWARVDHIAIPFWFQARRMLIRSRRTVMATPACPRRLYRGHKSGHLPVRSLGPDHVTLI